jgi:N-acetyl-anhydromuramyl-L-alanine amidase AmpD
VQRGETLSSVARDFSVGIPELAERNGLKPSSHLTAGQKLKIPSARSTATPRTRTAAAPITQSALPSSVQKAITSASVTAGRWKNIVIHHSGTSEGSAKGMNEYHLRVRHMEHGLAYHFVIGNGHGMGDGEIFVGDRWKKQRAGGHLASERQNEYCLGICLVGNFDKDQPTARQLNSLKTLIQSLENRCRLTPDAVKTHQQINVIPTRCPGERFPVDSFLRDLRATDSK